VAEGSSDPLAKPRDIDGVKGNCKNIYRPSFDKEAPKTHNAEHAQINSILVV